MPVRPWVALPAAAAPLGLGALQLARMRLRGVGAPPANLIGLLWAGYTRIGPSHPHHACATLHGLSFRVAS